VNFVDGTFFKSKPVTDEVLWVEVDVHVVDPCTHVELSDSEPYIEDVGKDLERAPDMSVGDICCELTLGYSEGNGVEEMIINRVVGDCIKSGDEMLKEEIPPKTVQILDPKMGQTCDYYVLKSEDHFSQNRDMTVSMFENNRIWEFQRIEASDLPPLREAKSLSKNVLKSMGIFDETSVALE
jgi:hypothetical protein